MALKYSFKLIFLKCLFDFMINTSPQASNSVNGREKCLLLALNSLIPYLGKIIFHASD